MAHDQPRKYFRLAETVERPKASSQQIKRLRGELRVEKVIDVRMRLLTERFNN